jgi:hypothetical protein
MAVARPDVDFVVNLRNSTASRDFRRKLRPPGYLVPPAYLTAELRAKAATFSRRGSLIVADNGLYDDIVRLAAQLAGVPRSAALAQQAAKLASTVDPSGHIEDQQAVRPTALIGMEDITAALWLRLGLTAGTLPYLRRALRQRNRRTAQKARVLAKTFPERCDYLPVASAQDYDTAFDAGREFASAGLTAAALGFGAFMNDDSSTSEVKIRGKYRRLERSMPNRYLRTALVARGFWDGWQGEREDAIERFHFLGLGAPIMLGIVTCAAAETPGLTFDATSPIRDAAEGTLYVTKPAYLKIRTWKAAERLASSPGEKWRCPCPFCKSFVKLHPFDYESGSKWYEDKNRPRIGPTALRKEGGLYGAYPLLSQPSGERGPEIDFARMGHNHWALKQVTRQVADARRSNKLDQHVKSIVEDYAAATPLRSYAAAVALAFEIAQGRWP